MKTLKERQELLRMALSMNITTNRKQERIDLLWSKLGIFEDNNKNLLTISPEVYDTVILQKLAFALSFLFLLLE